MKLGSLRRLRAMMSGIGLEIEVLFLSPEPVWVKGELAVIKLLAVKVFWLSEECIRWNRNPRSYKGQIAIDGSHTRPCGWAAVQTDQNGALTSWYGVGDMMPIELDGQRTFK